MRQKQFLSPPSPTSPINPNLFFSFDNRSNKRTPTKPQRQQASPEESTQIPHNIIRPKKNTMQSVSPKTRKYSETSQKQQINSAEEGSLGPSNGSTVYDEAASRYECIASLTEQENNNLKQQNVYLLEKLRKMQQRESKVKTLYQKAKKYKKLYQQAQLQIQQWKDECEVYKQQADQMKKILLTDVYKLKKKVMETEVETENVETILHEQNQQQVDETIVKHEKSRVISQTSTANKSSRKQSKSQQSESSLSKYLKPKQNSI